MRQASNVELLERAVRAERFADALDLCDRILESDPTHLPALEVKAKELWRRGEFEDSLAFLDAAATVYPYDPGYHFLRGDCLQQLHNYAGALRAFERCRNAGDERLAAEAEARIKELEEVQETLVAELVKSDPAFANAYRIDPPAALKEYGFKFARVRPNEKLVAKAARSAVWARPS